MQGDGSSHDGIAPALTRRRRDELERRAAQISVAVGAGTPLADVLRMVRDAFVEAVGFDRSGVSLYDRHADILLEYWTTDPDGTIIASGGAPRPVPDDPQSPLYRVVRGGEDLVLGRCADAADCACAALRLGGELVGVVWADRLPSGAPIADADLDLLRSGARDMTAAVLAARVSSRRDEHLEVAGLLTKVGAAVASEADLDDVLRMTRDAITTGGRLDRAALFLKDERTGALTGTWGTERSGDVEDLHGAHLQTPDDPQDPMNRVLRGEVPYSLVTHYSARCGLGPDNPMYGVQAHCVLPMRVGSEVLGIIVGDNLLSSAPITDEDVAILLPFAEQAALAVRSGRLRAQLQSRIAQLQHLGRIASAITANTELGDMMRLVRNGIVEAGLFDRAGVFLYDRVANTLRGTWGTDRDGKLEDITSNVQSVMPERGMPSDLVASGRIPYSLLDNRSQLGAERTPAWMLDVRWHAVVPMKAGDVIVGLISVDNLLTDRAITRSDVEMLLPFAEQAAAAVLKARLSDDLRARIAHLEILGNVGAAIASKTDLSEMLRMVRDAIVDSGMFDRAGVWLFDAATREIAGAWGTDRQGAPEDLSGQVQELTDSPNPLHRVLRGEVEYSLIADRTALGHEHTPEAMQGVRAHAVVPMRAGDEVLGAIGVDNLLTGRDITHDDVRALLPFAEQSAMAVQKARLIAEIEQANRDLEDRVALRTAELRRITDELAAFTYTLSHDLKAPVRAAHGFTCAVLEQHGEALPPDARRDLERVREAARRMGVLIEALLALGRLGQSSILRRRISPARLVRDLVRDLRGAFPHAVTITIGDLPVCNADHGLLRMTFHNLIKNALEATRDSTVATVHVGFEHGAYFVQDNGIGFDQQYAHTLFDLFRRYRPADEWEGSGFGLAFARRVVQMHGGRIWAEGEPGKGATFRFTIAPGEAPGVVGPPGVIS
jgi:signal transduction histidine kinase